MKWSSSSKVCDWSSLIKPKDRAYKHYPIAEHQIPYDILKWCWTSFQKGLSMYQCACIACIARVGCLCVCTDTCICAHTHTDMHTQMHTDTCTRTYTHTLVPVSQTFDLQASELGWGLLCDAISHPGGKQQALFPGLATVCVWLWLTLAENCPVRNVRILVLISGLTERLSGEREGAAHQATEQKAKRCCLVSFNLIFAFWGTAVILLSSR